MALKGDRVEHLTDLSYFMNSTGTRGLMVAHDTGGSGAAMDDSNAVVSIDATPSGANYAGMLLNDVVNLDLTRQHLNFHKDEVQQGGKVLLLRRGTVVTNHVSGTPTIGQQAYVDAEGRLTNSASQYGDSQHPAVGRFLSVADPDGYYKVEVNIV